MLMNMIEVRNIKKSYGKRQVLKGVSFTARQGECIGIVGANGCGKSTLLGILAGSLKADFGEISYNGENPLKNNKVFNKYIGYVPQENPLMDKLSVKDNLKFWYCDSRRSIKDDMENGILKEGCISADVCFGYFSRRDGARHRFDLCEDCYDEMISRFCVPVETTESTELL